MRYCSFCGKSDQEVSRLFAGPSGHVCGECVVLMYGMMSEDEKSGTAKPPAPPDKFYTINEDGSETEPSR